MLESSSEGVEVAAQAPISQEERENIVSMKGRGVSDSNIAAVLNISPKTVAVVVVQQGVAAPKKKRIRNPVPSKRTEINPDVPYIHPASVGDENWETEGLCRTGGYDPDLWFPHPTDTTVRGLAQRVCYRCPVIMECRTTALARGEKNGIWGGLTETQRKKMRARERERERQGTQENYEYDDDEEMMA